MQKLLQVNWALSLTTREPVEPLPDSHMVLWLCKDPSGESSPCWNSWLKFYFLYSNRNTSQLFLRPFSLFRHPHINFWRQLTSGYSITWFKIQEWLKTTQVPGDPLRPKPARAHMQSILQPKWHVFLNRGKPFWHKTQVGLDTPTTYSALVGWRSYLYKEKPVYRDLFNHPHTGRLQFM